MSANTISFADGGFAVGRVLDRDGTVNLDILEEDSGFRIFNDDGSTIVGLGLLTSEGGVRLFIGEEGSPGSNRAIRDSELNVTGDNGRIEVAGSAKRLDVGLQGGNNRFIVRGRAAKGAVNAERESIVRFKGIDIDGTTARGMEINLSDQDDKLVFGGSVRNTTINDLGGSDFIRFRGDIKNTDINLSDDSAATIRLSKNGEIDGLRINGADDDDVLFIGSTEYRFKEGNTWVDVNDPNDTRNF